MLEYILEVMDRHHQPRKQFRGGRPDRFQGPQLTHEEKFPPIPKPPKRDYDPCPISGNAIDNIFTAIDHRETGKPATFDGVLELIRNAENLPETDQLLYVGSGAFGVYQEVQENGLKKMVQVRKIVYEESHHKPDWRRELSPGISRDYIPAPRPLSELYTPEEERQFPKLGAGNVYMPRNS